jgi:hypothetical protein
MFLDSPRLLNIGAALLSAVLLGTAPPAHAGKSVFIRWKPHVSVAPPPLALDIVVATDGSARGAVIPLHHGSDITLKRGIIGRSADGGLQAIYQARLAQDGADGLQLLGDLSMRLQHDTTEYFRDDNGDILTLEIVDSATLSRSDPEWRYVPIRRTQGVLDDGDFIVFSDTANESEGYGDIPFFTLNFEPIKFEPGDGEQLWGEPDYLFNRPRPGEALTAELPALLPGEVFEQDLFVYSSERATAQMIQVRLRYKF